MCTHPTLLLFFAMQLDQSGKLHQGRLNLVDTSKRGIVGRWQATSGLADYQRVGGWQKRGGGVIPATYQLIPPIDWYLVTTKPTDFSGVKGIDGNGYPILPFAVTTEDGTIRGDFLIHRDANMPGTLGCIGIKESDWSDFERIFSRETQQTDRVKLLVSHTY